MAINRVDDIPSNRTVVHIRQSLKSRDPKKSSGFQVDSIISTVTLEAHVFFP